MKKEFKNRILTIIILIVPFIAYSWFRSVVSKIAFINVLDSLMSTVIVEIWKLISSPIIFVSLLVFILIWKFRNHIELMFPNVKEIKAGSFSALFEKTSLETDYQLLSPKSSKKDKNTIEEDKVIAENLLEGASLQALQLFLYFDGKILSGNDLREKMLEQKIGTNAVENQGEKIQKIYMNGVLRAYIPYVLKKLFEFDYEDEAKTKAIFNLKKGLRKKIEDEIKERKMKTS